MQIDELFLNNGASIQKNIDNFEKYVRRQVMARFLVRYELFKKIKEVKGNIVECGVYHGGGIFAWAKLSTILEPYALYRKIIGFDTFEGFPTISNEDISNEKNKNLRLNGMNPKFDVYQDLLNCEKLYDENRFLNNFSKIELIKGNAIKTIPEYVKNNNHLTISMLFLDFDLYEPTKIALEYLYPKVVKGGIVVFDEINNPIWPGESQAIYEYFNNFNDLRIKKFDFEPKMSYIIKE